MAIRTPSVPAAAAAALAQSTSWSEFRSLRPWTSATSAPVRVTDHVPSHPLYYLSLEQVIGGEGLDRATLIGWRHLVEEDGAMWSLLTESVSGESFRFAWRSPVQGIELGLSSLQYLASLTVSTEDLEFRAVTVPPLMELGFWLINPHRQPSAILPIETCVTGLTIGQARTELEVLVLLYGPARDLMAFTPRAGQQ